MVITLDQSIPRETDGVLDGSLGEGGVLIYSHIDEMQGDNALVSRLPHIYTNAEHPGRNSL